MKTLFKALVCVFFLSGCIEIDFFLFESEEATSVEEDYHGLPLFAGESPPQWITDVEVEREIYVRVPSGEEIPSGSFEGEKDYIHGVFLHAPATCPVEQCPLIDDSVTFIYQHGNSGHMYRYWYRAVALWNMGANVMIYTYRGYGLSKGNSETSRSSILQDAVAAMKYLGNRADIDPSRIIAYGYSMGGIPTSYLVSKSEHKDRFAGAVLESALDSPVSPVNLSTGTSFPEGFFLEETPFDGPRFMKESSLPVLHMHGAKDRRVVLIQAERYYETLKDRTGYTHYLGKTSKEHEDWIEETGHRNIPISSFKAESQISDHWGSDDNPAHCCVHPLEYTIPDHSRFLREIGGTTGDDMYRSSLRYKSLVSDWVKSLL